MKKFKELSLWKKLIIIIIALLFLPFTISLLILFYSVKYIIKSVKKKKYLITVLLIIPLIIGFTALTTAINVFTPITTPPTDNNIILNNSTNNELNEDDNQNEIIEDTEVLAESKETLPVYEVISIDNSNIGQIIRETLNIVVKDDFTLKQLYKIAEKEINSYINTNKVNALTVGFFTDKDHIGKGYDMGYVEYVPNGKFSDAVNVKAGDYSIFKFVNNLEEPLVFEKGEEIKDGQSNLDIIKSDFESIYDNLKVSIEKKNDTLYVKVIEPTDHPLGIVADENAISVYTDYCLDNIMGDINNLDITIVRPSSSVSALLSMSKMLTDNGRYFDTSYIMNNLK